MSKFQYAYTLMMSSLSLLLSPRDFSSSGGEIFCAGLLETSSESEMSPPGRAMVLVMTAHSALVSSLSLLPSLSLSVCLEGWGSAGVGVAGARRCSDPSCYNGKTCNLRPSLEVFGSLMLAPKSWSEFQFLLVNWLFLLMYATRRIKSRCMLELKS